METMTVTKISISVLAMNFQVPWLYKVSLPSSGRRKSYQWLKFSIFLLLTTLKNLRYGAALIRRRRLLQNSMLEHESETKYFLYSSFLQQEQLFT